MRNIRMVLAGAVLLAFALVGNGCGSRQTAQGASVAQQAQNQPAESTNVQPAQPAPVSSDAPTPPAPYPASNYVPPPQPAAISVPAGTLFRVRLDETLDTRHNRAGDPFSATLARGIVEQGAMIIPAGTRCYGHLIESKRSGRFKGRAVLSLKLDWFDLRGQRYEIATASDARVSGKHKKRNWVLIGGGSGTGAAIGAVAGGPVGAAIGAGVGGAAGTVTAAITGKKNVRLPVETMLAFSLRAPVTVEE